MRRKYKPAPIVLHRVVALDTTNEQPMQKQPKMQPGCAPE
jgi:hypothetical protein